MTGEPESNAPVRKAIMLGEGYLSCLEWPNPDAPAILFAHANGFNAQTYCKFLAPFSRAFHVVACDLRGHGFSTLPASTDMAKNWTIFRDDLLGAMEQIFSKPGILAGHSLGATSSLMAAARAQNHIRALLLIEPVLIPPLRRGDEQGAGELARRAERRRSVFPSFVAAFNAYRRRGIFASWPEEVVADYLRGGLIETEGGSLRLACRPEWEAAIFRGAPHDTAPLARDLGCPITIVVGTKESATSTQQLDVIRQVRPDARIREVKGASHFIPMECPDVLHEEVLRLSEAA